MLTTDLLIAFSVILAIRIVAEKSIVKCILYSAVLSALVGIAFYTLNAPDLAITQISVNAVLLTLLFAYTLSKYGEYYERKSKKEMSKEAKGYGKKQ